MIRDVPKDAGRIRQIQHAKPPGLHGRRLRHDAGVFLGELRVVDVLPPRIGVVHHEMHHEVFRELLDVVVLQEEAERANLQLRDLLARPVFLEAEIGVELARDREVPGGDECLQVDCVLGVNTLLYMRLARSIAKVGR